MEYVQTKLMNYYSPAPPSCPRPFQSPFDCCISSPLSTPILLPIKRFLLVLYKSNVYNHRNAIGTNQWRLDDRCPCANMIQSAPLAGKYTLLTGSSPIQQGRYKSRKGWPRPGAYGKSKIFSVAAVVVATLPQMTVGRRF